ncbi:MAG: hypothetical protein NTV30_10605 [Chloroflexi bacterium]|nr:hypothetical protein [Chloroflexota bacterium]
MVITGSKKIRVLLVDDHRVVRVGLRRILELDKEMLWMASQQHVR